MVRFKVIRGSHLLLALSALILAAVVVIILLQITSTEPDDTQYFSSGIHQKQTEEAKVAEAFASNSFKVSARPMQIEIVVDEAENPPLYEAPSILVYHTHTHEAYEQNSSTPYEATDNWRTDDPSHSVVRVGSALVDELSKLGFFAFHDTTDHELSDLDQSYVRSLETLESYSEEFDLIIDLHRDAYADGMPMNLKTDSGACAQLMAVIGDGGNYSGIDAPDYNRNLLFAQSLTSELNRQCKGIARNVTIKHGRFNQHIGKTAVLVEVGHNRNTLVEALNSIPILARSIAKILS